MLGHPLLKFFLQIVLFISTMAGGSAYAIKPVTLNTKAQKDDVILIQSAKSGTIEQDKTEKNIYKITLENAMPYLSYVADRPSRVIGKIPLEKYLNLWQSNGPNSFKNNPPNAIINASTNENQTEKSLDFALELSDPQYDNQTNTFSYRAKTLVGEGPQIPTKAHFDHITLIIDNVCIGCWN